MTSEVRIEYMPLEKIARAPRNPKKHDIPAIIRSIQAHGFVDPLVQDDSTGRLVAGHGRLEALIAMRAGGMPPPTRVKPDGKEWLVPVLRGVAFESEEAAEQYLIRSNRLVEKGGWDIDELSAMVAEIDDEQFLIDMALTPADIERMGAAADADGPPAEIEEDEPPEPVADPYVKPGELWALGDHRIICGDCTDPEVVRRLMGGQLASICWTDPPWNVAYGKSDHPSYRKREIANDDLGEAFPGFCAAFCAGIKAATKPGAALYMAMSAQEWPVIDAALRHAGFHWSATIIWAKDSLVLGRGDYHRQYEPLWYGWNADAARLHPLEDRKQSDLWNIDRPKKSELHPTMKPVELVARALQNSSHKGDVVFEPFSGSGTTIIAAEQTGRGARAVELEARYVQVALERWKKLTGKEPVLIGAQ